VAFKIMDGASSQRKLEREGSLPCPRRNETEKVYEGREQCKMDKKGAKKGVYLQRVLRKAKVIGQKIRRAH